MAKLTEGIGADGNGPMQPGETRVITVYDWDEGKGRIDRSKIVCTFTLHRTERSFVEDWCDAANQSLAERGLKGFEYRSSEHGGWSFVELRDPTHYTQESR